MKHQKLVNIILIAWCALFFSDASNAELVFSAPPRESMQAGIDLYGPLVDHLSELLGEKVAYQYPKNWLQYQRDLRKGKYDIVFDGPHFVSWRMAHLDHEVLVKLPGKFEFLVVTETKSASIRNIKDLIGKKICAIPPPNLATLMTINLFRNPVRQPIIWGVKGGYGRVFEAFENRECSAMVLGSDYYRKKLRAVHRAGKTILYKSKPMPNQAMSVSRKINKIDRLRIIRSLTLGRGKAISTPIANRFGGKKARPFVAATKKEYQRHRILLEDVVFGW